MPDEGELSQNYWLRIHQIQAGIWVTQTRDLTKHDCRDAGGRAMQEQLPREVLATCLRRATHLPVIPHK